VNLFALLWGFAEATLFFIVPDVLLSLIALESRRRAWVASGFAVAGALLGGGLMFHWAGLDAEQARQALAVIPAISSEMLSQVRQQLESAGLASLFAGSITGVPYKTYAVEAGALGLPLAGFLLVSIPARALRFLAVTALVGWIARRWMGRMTHGQRVGAALAGWLVFYAWYFSVM
jgi:membrane protein YqaA with SNARE-associated domain